MIKNIFKNEKYCFYCCNGLSNFNINFRFLITNATSKWKELIIDPVSILFNLYEFIRTLTNFSEYYEKTLSEKPLKGIKRFTFKWQLYVHERGENQVERVIIIIIINLSF